MMTMPDQLEPWQVLDRLGYLDALHAAVNGECYFTVGVHAPGYTFEMPVVVTRVAPPEGKQRKPQVRWRWHNEPDSMERTCSIGTFRRATHGPYLMEQYPDD